MLAHIRELPHLWSINCSRKFDYINWTLLQKRFQNALVCLPIRIHNGGHIAPNCSLPLQSVVRINISRNNESTNLFARVDAK